MVGREVASASQPSDQPLHLARFLAAACDYKEADQLGWSRKRNFQDRHDRHTVKSPGATLPPKTCGNIWEAMRHAIKRAGWLV